jgi:biopolymer transport protein ExbD
MLSSPLDLKSHLHPPNFRMNVVPCIDILLICLSMFLMSSKYITAPGVSVDLPSAFHVESKGVSSVLTVMRDNMLIYEGRIYSIDEFKRAMRSNPLEQEVLLFKLSKDVPMQTFLNLCDIVRESGVKQIQIAAESR